MNLEKSQNISSDRKNILIIGLTKHLSGVPIQKVIAVDWDKETAQNVKSLFENIGIDLDPNNVEVTLEGLRRELKTRPWNGIILGWCIRGHIEFTELFEKVVGICFEFMTVEPRVRIMFSTGPNNLVETVLRSFS